VPASTNEQLRRLAQRFAHRSLQVWISRSSLLSTLYSMLSCQMSALSTQLLAYLRRWLRSSLKVEVTSLDLGVDSC